MNTGADSPRRLRRLWAALLLAPVAWAAALGTGFALTEDACVRGARGHLWAVMAVCIVLGLAGAALAWQERRPTDGDGGLDRARFMSSVALGLSAIFVVVLLLTAVPILLLTACRT